MVINYMELVVDKLLPTLLNDYDNVCQCETCIEDMKAYALNNLKPMYYASEKGEVFMRLNQFLMQFNADVTKAIINAIETVSSNPRHNTEHTH